MNRVVCKRVDSVNSNGEKTVELVCKAPAVQSSRKVGTHPSSNVYLFGDSISDPGNLPLEQMPAPLLVGSADVPAGPVTFQLRINGDSRNTDGQTWAYFVANDLDYNYVLGSGLTKLTPKHGEFINFAITGASQTQNNVLLMNNVSGPVPHFLSFKWQIEHFTEMVSVPGARTVKKDDVFIMAGLGGNEMLIIINSLPLIPPANWTAFVTSQVSLYVTSVVTNITYLYNAGMRRLFLTVTDNFDTTIYAAKLELINPGFTAGFITPTTAALQSTLLAFLDANKASLWPLLELNVSKTSDFFGEILSDATTNGITLPPIGTFPNFNSIAGNGLWPASLPNPDPSLRSATNVLFADDVHPTQHTHRLFADLYL